jgi:hypothetical protein
LPLPQQIPDRPPYLRPHERRRGRIFYSKQSCRFPFLKQVAFGYWFYQGRLKEYGFGKNFILMA